MQRPHLFLVFLVRQSKKLPDSDTQNISNIHFTRAIFWAIFKKINRATYFGSIQARIAGHFFHNHVNTNIQLIVDK